MKNLIRAHCIFYEFDGSCPEEPNILFPSVGDSNWKLYSEMCKLCCYEARTCNVARDNLK